MSDGGAYAMEMNQPGTGRGLPPKITLTAAPWAGEYVRAADASAGGLYSYWGPNPGGKVRRTGGESFIKPEYDTPVLHISVDPQNADRTLHLSLDVSTGRGVKYAHLYTSGWDTRALDSQSYDRTMAADETHPGVLFRALQEATGQVTAFRGLNDYEYQRAKYVADEDQYGTDYPAATGAQAVGNPTEEGYLDTTDGELMTFDVHDSSNNNRSLTIERSVLESAADESIQLPAANSWVRVKWANREAVLPDTLFTVT